MSPDTARWIRMVLNAFLAGLTAGGSLLLNSLADKGEFTTRAVVIASITGVMLMANDLKSYLSQPPPSLGGTALPAIQEEPLAPHVRPVAWEAKRDAFLAGDPKET